MSTNHLFRIPLYVIFSLITAIINESVIKEEDLEFAEKTDRSEDKKGDFNDLNPNYLLNLISLNYQ